MKNTGIVFILFFVILTASSLKAQHNKNDLNANSEKTAVAVKKEVGSTKNCSFSETIISANETCISGANLQKESVSNVKKLVDKEDYIITAKREMHKRNLERILKELNSFVEKYKSNGL